MEGRRVRCERLRRGCAQTHGLSCVHKLQLEPPRRVVFVGVLGAVSR